MTRNKQVKLEYEKKHQVEDLRCKGLQASGLEAALSLLQY